MIPTISIHGLHFEYQLWQRELVFYKEEIIIFENHLCHLSSTENGRSFSRKMEQYQNQFIIQKEIIDHLRHDLHVSEVQLASFTQELTSEGVSGIRMDNHTQLRDRMIAFRRIYRQMKEDYRRFEAQCSRTELEYSK